MYTQQKIYDNLLQNLTEIWGNNPLAQENYFPVQNYLQKIFSSSCRNAQAAFENLELAYAELEFQANEAGNKLRSIQSLNQKKSNEAQDSLNSISSSSENRTSSLSASKSSNISGSSSNNASNRTTATGTLSNNSSRTQSSLAKKTSSKSSSKSRFSSSNNNAALNKYATDSEKGIQASASNKSDVLQNNQKTSSPQLVDKNAPSYNSGSLNNARPVNNLVNIEVNSASKTS